MSDSSETQLFVDRNDDEVLGEQVDILCPLLHSLVSLLSSTVDQEKKKSNQLEQIFLWSEAQRRNSVQQTKE